MPTSQRWTSPDIQVDSPSMSAPNPGQPATGGTIPTLALLALLSAAPFPPAPWGAGLFLLALGVTVTSAKRSPPRVLHFGVLVTLMLGLLAIPGAWMTWPGPMILALALYWGARRRLPKAPGSLSRGEFDRGNALLMTVFIVLSASALVGWWWLFDPDLSDAVSRLPEVHVAVLIAAGLAFACLNALGEEVIWRGLGMGALHACGITGAPAHVLQAVSFGLMHIHGFPRGWIGVGLASVYGLMMGLLRIRSRGLLVPWVAHVFADLVIFAVLAALAAGSV